MGRPAAEARARQRGPLVAAAVVIVVLAVLAALIGARVLGGGGGSPATAPGTTSLPSVHRDGPMLVGTYMGRNAWEAYRSTFGSYPDVETSYLNANQTKTPDIVQDEQAIDRGISPIITLGCRFGPFTRAEIAAWGPQVQTYYQGFVEGLKILADYAHDKGNGTRVYFADEHEAVVKINQHKYSFAGYGSSQVPTISQSAAAWNQVMGYVARAAPRVVRVYWYGGSGAGEDEFAADLRPDLIQMATFDPYRWKHDSARSSAQELWGPRIAHLLRQPWMRRSNGMLKPWGLTEWGTDASHGDAANATFVSQTLRYLDDAGATVAVYFSRVDGNDASNDFAFTRGDQPRTLEAYRTALRELGKAG